MSESRPPTILCLASYEKGHDFLRAAKEQGWRVLLLTQTALEHAPWPRDVIDEFYMLPDMYNRDELLKGVSYAARTEQIDRIVALDDFDVEYAAALREHLRIPGLGESAARLFRDKLAMRVAAADAAICVPPFVHTVNDARLRAFVAEVPAPWVLKPRAEASSVGIRRLERAADLWPALEELGDRRSFYLLEQFVVGDVYHVDALVAGGDVVFAEVHRYAVPLLEVTHGGGIFCSRTLPRDSADVETLRALNAAVLRTFGLRSGAAHTEFIKGADGVFRFLETSARVGGAFIAELVEAASGVNLWREWARIETGGAAYQLPAPRADYGGVVISLARQEWPDLSAYTDPEIVQRIDKHHHAGLVVAAPTPPRVDDLLAGYMRRFETDFMAFHPAPDKPTS